MTRLLLIAILLPALASASPFDDAAALSEAWKKSPDMSLLNDAARLPWPVVDAVIEHEIALNIRTLPADVRRAWVLDRALPVLSGKLDVPDDVLPALVETLEQEEQRSGDLALMNQARRMYSEGAFKNAHDVYSKIERSSALWPDALRERAWTLLLLGQPADALGASVSLRSPWFHVEDHAEAHLLEANVLLEKCRWSEARERVAPLTKAVTTVDVERIPEMLLTEKIPDAWRPHIESPLVARVRRTLLLPPPTTASGRRRYDAIKEFGQGLLVEEITAQQRADKDVARRALSVVYEALRSERLLRETGSEPAASRVADLGPLNDDEVAWEFRDRWWRDEIGTYRYLAGDACERKEKR